MFKLINVLIIMKKYPFEISALEINDLDVCLGTKCLYELVFISKGKGVLYLDQQECTYQEKDFYILSPYYPHTFLPEETTVFTIIRFTEVFFNHQNINSEDWFKRLEIIFCNHSKSPNVLMFSTVDKEQIAALINVLLNENDKKNINTENIIVNIIQVILSIVERNILISISTSFLAQKIPNKILEIINYIHAQIYEPKALTIDNISRKFNVSPNYLNEYFKKHSGSSIKNYILKYKVKLIKYKLEYSDASISELAYMFNFSDESHLNKVFNKFEYKNPSFFKKNQ